MRLVLSKEVERAISENRPVVALESTIISHGMPYPKNLEVALRCEEIVRSEGATPATCAVIGGALCAGLDDEQLEHLATARDIEKLSRRDLALASCRELDGATTVAATMIIAHMAGIEVFATGGVGGVHRGAQTTMDISADLEELSRTPVAVVCAGVKSILDIGLTLEYLETKGVPVVAYRTEEFPAFYTRQSGYYADARLDSPEEAAELIAAQRKLGTGILIANPIPEEYSMDGAVVERAIAAALEEARTAGVRGKAVTPFLLERVRQETSGDSLEANAELVYSNARLAARIAVCAKN
ncbi:MAG: pseudouridine-5'-phosphate glycosidase [Clostridia bacterium]|nr:pseudouridine-5'-phosphate glycosidase [Clostridia bacterium]